MTFCHSIAPKFNKTIKLKHLKNYKSTLSLISVSFFFYPGQPKLA